MMEQVLLHLRQQPDHISLSLMAAERLSDTTLYALQILASVHNQKHAQQLLMHALRGMDVKLFEELKSYISLIVTTTLTHLFTI
jgi:hypothetical protein